MRAEIFSGELREKDEVDDAVFLVDDATPPKGFAVDTASISETNATETATVSNVFFAR